MDSSANTISLICLILLVEIIQTSLQFSNKSKALLLPYSGGASFCLRPGKRPHGQTAISAGGVGWGGDDDIL